VERRTYPLLLKVALLKTLSIMYRRKLGGGAYGGEVRPDDVQT
jgi:hypothetical protein